jgi:hypothetical protein
MKHLIFIIFSICLLPLVGKSQKHIFTPVVGLNVSSFDKVIEVFPEFTSGNLNGYFWGVNYSYKIKEQFGVTTGIIISNEGSEILVLDQLTRTIDLTYCRIPLMGTYFIGTSSFQPKINLGLELGILSGKEFRNELDNVIPTNFSVNGLDVGARGGLGFNYYVNEGTVLAFDLGYSLGLTKINDEQALDSKNRRLFFSLAYGATF